MSDKPKFAIKQRGYDRFSVDNYIHDLQHQLDFANSKLEVYRNQLDFLTHQFDNTQEDKIDLLNQIKVLEIEKEQITDLYADMLEAAEASEEDLQEAQEAADQIILEALLIAQEVLETLNDTVYTTKDIKLELLDDLYKITNEVVNMETEEPLVIKWMDKKKG